MRRQRQQRGGRTRETTPQSSSAQSSHSSSARVFNDHGIDINTNLGEGFGHYRIEGESDMLPYVTSANIACGAHAGDPMLMEAALEEVRYYGLSLGAHIGYPDLAGFGRREIHLSTAELRASILFQLGGTGGTSQNSRIRNLPGQAPWLSLSTDVSRCTRRHDCSAHYCRI